VAKLILFSGQHLTTEAKDKMFENYFNGMPPGILTPLHNLFILTFGAIEHNSRRKIQLLVKNMLSKPSFKEQQQQ
jgi:hypothetical protein